MKLHSGNFIQRYSLFILILWVILVCIALPFLPFANKPFKIGGITDPNVESSEAENIMLKKLPYGGSRFFILYESEKYQATDSKFISEVNKSLSGLKDFPLSHRIISPFQNPRQISDDKHSAYAMVVLDKAPDESANYAEQFRQLLGTPKSLKMYVGGEPFYISDVKKLSRTDLLRADVVAIPISILTLILIFGTVIAGLLPVICGLFTITIIIAFLYFLGHYFELSIFVLNIATMLGLGLSLDYTLLIVSRFREELSNGRTNKEAISITLETAGKAVFFSGIAVLISMAALLLFPVNILYSIGIGGVIVVIMSILTALFFLPSLLIRLGKNVNRLAFFSRRPAAKNPRKTFWFRIAMGIMRRPLIVFFPTMLFLILLGYPFLHVKINRPDPKILPTWVESRQLLDKFHEKFNANDLTPIFVVAESNSKSITSSKNISALYDFSHDLENDKRVEHISSIVNLDPKISKKQYQVLYQSDALTPSQKNFFDQSTNGRFSVITVVSKYPDNSEQTFKLVKKIRDSHVGNHIKIQVGGYSAVIIDTIQSVYKRFFFIIVLISVITYIVLLILLRSIFLPLKAIIMNFLSLSVSYGMLVFIFQEGHFSHLLNFKMQGFTDLNLPILLFCGIFGLSMDYEVFLLSRIKEFYERTGDNNLSVALGLERSARVITSAALIVVLVASSFVTANILFVKAFGLATALAVAVDASVIRLLLVPATMRLLGKWNWYLPAWLDRILPKSTFTPKGK